MNDKYITMCREAKELQEAWEPKEWDRVHYGLLVGSKDEVWYLEYISDEFMEDYDNDGLTDDWNCDKDGYKWIPHQEQIQELMKRDKIKLKIMMVIEGDEDWDEWWLEKYMEACHKKYWSESEQGWVVG